MDKHVSDSSPILQKYLEAYKRNSSSRVFAPLAEVYRKNGKISEAFRILEKGIALHPTYIMGHLCLAKCFFDLGQFDKSYSALLPFVPGNFDNISLQKIFAESCLKLGRKDQALNTYKHLLYLNPKDLQVSDMVFELEKDFQSTLVQKIPAGENISTDEISSGHTLFDDVDDWVQVDFVSDEDYEKSTPPPEASKPVCEKVDKSAVSTLDSWQMVNSFSNSLKLSQDSDHEESAEEDDQELSEESEQPATPFMSHTLVDLYCAQKYYDKAIDLLQKILELNPNDQRTKDKLNEVKALVDNSVANIRDDIEEGYSDLMKAYDQKFSSFEEEIVDEEEIVQDLKEQKLENLKQKYDLFMAAIRRRAEFHG